MNVKWYDHDWPVISHLFAHVSDLMAFKKQESVQVIQQCPGIRGLRSPWCIGGVWRKKNTWGWGGTQADTIMLSLLCSPTPWRSRALCAVCVRSPRRSCLCFWTAAESAVYSKIHLEELQRCQGCRERGGINMINTPPETKVKSTQRKTEWYAVTSVWHCSACSRSMLSGRPDCWQPISPLGRPSSHMMCTLPFVS